MFDSTMPVHPENRASSGKSSSLVLSFARFSPTRCDACAILLVCSLRAAWQLDRDTVLVNWLNWLGMRFADAAVRPSGIRVRVKFLNQWVRGSTVTLRKIDREPRLRRTLRASRWGFGFPQVSEPQYLQPRSYSPLAVHRTP